MSASTTTRIDGPLVYLEVPGPEHLPTIWKVYLDAPDYFEALTGSSDFDPGDIELMYEDAITDDARYYFAVRRTDNKSLIGTVEVEVGSAEVPSVLHGLVLSQAERGRGYGRPDALPGDRPGEERAAGAADDPRAVPGADPRGG